MKNIIRCCCLLFLLHFVVSFHTSNWKLSNSDSSVKNIVEDLEAPIASLALSAKIFETSKYFSLLLILAGFALFPSSAWSDDKGTKTDKYFESCMSKCVFAETRPPPVGSSNDRLEAKKSRGEILGDCKRQCATTKEQLLIGAPKQKAAE